MKVAFPILATLALVAASPLRLDERDGDKDLRVSAAVDGKCGDGETVFQDDGKALCCPAGSVCDS
jgi:hypothetical protein